MADRTANVKVSADASRYFAEMRRAQAATDKFARATKKAGSSNAFKGIGRSAIAATAGVVSLYGAYAQGKKAIDATTKLAKGTLQLQRVTNLSAQDASRFAAVLQERGIEANKASMSFTALSKQIVAAQSGTKKAADAFKQLGVSQELIKKGDTQAVLLKAADGLSKMGAGANRTALAAQLFGKGYKDLLPLLLLGSKGISKQTELAGKLGAEFSGKGLQSAKQFIAAQREMKTTVLGLQVAVGTALMPALTKGMQAVTKFAIEFRSGKGAGGDFKRTLIDIKDALVPVATFLKDHAKLVFGMITAWYAFKKAALAINVFQTIMGGFGGVGKWQAAGAARGTALRLGLAASLILLVPTISKELSKLSPMLARYSGEAQGSAGKAWKNLGTDLADVLTGGIFARLVGLKPLISSAGKDVGKTLAGGIKQSGPTVYSSLNTLMNQLNKHGLTKAEAFGTVGTTIAGAVRHGILAEQQSVKNAMGSVIAAAKKKGIIAADAFGPIGLNMAHGVGAGIAQGIDSVVNMAIKMVDDANNAAKKHSQQNSPSLLFAEIGLGLVEGMALGMSKTAPLVKAAKNMVTKATPKKSFGVLNGTAKSIMTGNITAAGGFGAGTITDVQELAAAQYAAANVKKLSGAKTKKGKAAQKKANDAAQRRADAVVTAIEAKQAAKQARATAAETLKGFVQGILDTIKSTEIDRIMAPVTARRAQRASDQLTADKASLTTKIGAAQNERDSFGNLLPGSKAALRYARDGARLDAKIAQAKKQGNLDAIDQLEGEKKALDDRYGPAYLKGLKDQLQSLSDDEIEASSEKAGTLLADKFKVGLNSALDALLNGGSVTAFFAKLTTVLSGSGVSLGSLPSGVTSGVPEAIGAVGSTTGAGTPAAGGGAGSISMSLKDWVNAWLEQHPQYTKATGKQAAASIIGAAFGVSKGDVVKAGGTFGGRVANRASGGYLSPGALTMVGETGPELIMGGKVSSSTRTHRMGSAGMNITINAVGAAANDPVVLARELGWQLATR